MKLGQMISSLRMNKGWSQIQFAELMNTTEASINRWENDKAVPRTKAKIAMADLFGVNVEDLNEVHGASVLNQIVIQRPMVELWLREKFADGFGLTLITRTGHYNMVVARKSSPVVEIDVLTGMFDLDDVRPLIREGTINTFISAGADEFNRLRTMQMRDSEVITFLNSAERFESNKVYSSLLDRSDFAEDVEEAILLEKWRKMNAAQKKSTMILIDVKLEPEEFDEKELARLTSRYADDDEATGSD